MRVALFVLLISVNAVAYSGSGPTVIVNNHDAPAAFELQDVKGNLYRLTDYRGRWVIVNFWASWCGPCIREIPELKRFYQQFRDRGVVVIGINFEELTTDQLEQAIGEFGIDYPVLRIGGIPLVPFEPLRGLPSTFAVSPQGRLVKSWVGPVNEDMLNTFIMKQFEREKS